MALNAWVMTITIQVLPSIEDTTEAAQQATIVFIQFIIIKSHVLLKI